MQSECLRIDKWLWHARFYRTRSLAQAAAASGVLRLNNARVEKASVGVKSGDVLTVPRGREVVVVQVQALGTRRGPAAEAQALYELVPETALDPAATAA
jgi:ribosome-associated heat shock protein Hsp15